MDKASTLTEVSNLALTLLGEPAISSIDSTTEPAPTLRRVFPGVLRTHEAAYRWPELITEWAPTEPEEELSSDDWYMYALPADCLRILEEIDGYTYRIEGEYLITPSNAPTFRYLAYSEAVGDWGPQLLDVIAYALAIQVAPKLEQGVKTAEALRAVFDARILPQARRVSAMHGTGITYRARRHRWSQRRMSWI